LPAVRLSKEDLALLLGLLGILLTLRLNPYAVVAVCAYLLGRFTASSE
jgi:hypothetical protein